jgi:hypothetical protein
VTQETFSPWLQDTRPEWNAAVHSWLTDAGSALGLGRIKAVSTVKERPWSVVQRVTFEIGHSYFKACALAGRHEVPLMLFLEQQRLFDIPEVQAVEMAQHWLLLADAGRPLREVLADEKQVQVFPPLLARYAALQIATTHSVEHLLALGLPDRRLEHLAALLQTLLADKALEAWRSPAANAGNQAADLLPSLIRVCNELAGTAYAEALDHGDLHRGNVLAANGRYSLIDWGDACLTHPFSSIMLPLETLLQHIPQADRLKWAFYLRDAYLEPWETFAPRRQLLADFEQALWVAHLLRALNMAHMFAAADEATLNRWRPMILEQLENWVAHHAWLGRGLAGWLQTLPSA